MRHVRLVVARRILNVSPNGVGSRRGARAPRFFSNIGLASDDAAKVEGEVETDPDA